jgi:hypothetical protein
MKSFQIDNDFIEKFSLKTIEKYYLKMMSKRFQKNNENKNHFSWKAKPYSKALN